MAKKHKVGNKFFNKVLQKTAYMAYGMLRSPMGNGIEWIANKMGVGDGYRNIGVIDELVFMGAGWGLRKAGAYKVPFLKDITAAPSVIEWARVGELVRDKVTGMITGGATSSTSMQVYG